MTNRFELYRGDVLLGVVEHTADDFPNHLGVFYPNDAFAEVESLFASEIQMLDKGRMDEWRELRERIERPGLRLNPVGPGKEVKNPLIHIDGSGKVWWR